MSVTNWLMVLKIYVLKNNCGVSHNVSCEHFIIWIHYKSYSTKIIYKGVNNIKILSAEYELEKFDWEMNNLIDEKHKALYKNFENIIPIFLAKKRLKWPVLMQYEVFRKDKKKLDLRY